MSNLDGKQDRSRRSQPVAGAGRAGDPHPAGTPPGSAHRPAADKELPDIQPFESGCSGGKDEHVITSGGMKGCAASPPATTAARSWVSTSPAGASPGPDILAVNAAELKCR
jgi:hypothetical protein